jgi:hypothetical protein
MSVLKYNELLNEMKREVCEELSRKGFGEYNRMLYSLGLEKDSVLELEVELEVELEKDCVEELEVELEVELEKESVLDVGLDVGLDVEVELEVELEKELILDSVLEVKKKDMIINKRVTLPWCGEVLSGRCNALVLNCGLYTQCMKESELYCKGCMNKKEKNGDVFMYGTVEERLRCEMLEYKDSKGKCEVLYSSVMKKEGISREEAEVEAGKLGWVIPESYFEVKASKRGRPKKNVEKEDIVEKKTRGRPKKEKETIVGNVGEDLIASLIEEKMDLEENDILEESVEEKNVDEEESEEECEVIKFEYNGRCYLKSGDNVLFDIESHDCVGLWNGSSIDDIKEDEE